MAPRSLTSLLLVSSSAVLEAAFVPPASTPAARGAVASRTAATPITMVSSREVFGQLYEASPPAQKTMQALPTPVAKGAMAGLVGVTAAAGFILTPSRRIAVNAVGGALTAQIGNIARKKVAVERQKAAMPAVAALLAEGLQSVDASALGAIASEYNVPKKQFDSQLGDLYLAYLNACLASPQVQTAELSELLQLQTLLKLSAAQAGNQVYAAARQLFSRHRAYLEDEGDNDSKQLLKKFVFLAERIVERDDSAEGYRYETLRLQKLFNLTPPEWRAMAEAAGIPFYEKAIASAVLERKPATPERLAGMRGSLGISEGCAEGLHADVFGKCASEMLVGGSLSAEDQARIAEVINLLGMPEEDSGRTLGALTEPLYSASFSEVVAGLEGTDAAAAAAQASGKLAARQQELMLDAQKATAVEAAALRAQAAALLKDATGHLKVQNVPSALASMQSLVAYVEQNAAFMTAMGRDGAATLFDGLRGQRKASEVLALYRLVLLEYLKDLKVDATEEANLALLRNVLGLSEAECTSVYVAAAGPLFKTALTEAMGDGADLGAGAKAKLDESIASLALPAEVTAAISSEAYADKLGEFTADEATIMSEEQAAELSKLRDFLGLQMDDLYEAHEAACSASYRKSVREVMGTSGIIPDEYWEGLFKLRERLGLSEDVAQALVGEEVTVKMVEFGQKAEAALEAKASSQQKAQQAEKGEKVEGDMAIKDATITTEINELIEFAAASKALATKTVDGAEVDVIGASLKGQMEGRTLKELYRQYVVEAFSSSDPGQNAKSMGNLGKLALVLGLGDEDVLRIHNEIGALIYRQYISKALQKGPLGAEETTFLASVKDALGLEQAKCDELIREQQLNRVSVLIESIFGKSSVTADDVRKMRETADLYDIDLVADLEISELQRTRMFVCELEDFVSTGELSTSDTRALEELCEVFHISEEKAQTTLDGIITKRTGSGVLQAAALLRQGESKLACEELSGLLKFAALNPDTLADAPAVSEGERTELYMVYQASLMTGGMNSEKTERLELLKSLMGLSIEVAA